MVPPVLAVGAGVKNLSGKTAMPPLRIWYMITSSRAADFSNLTSGHRHKNSEIYNLHIVVL